MKTLDQLWRELAPGIISPKCGEPQRAAMKRLFFLSAHTLLAETASMTPIDRLRADDQWRKDVQTFNAAVERGVS